MMIQSLIVIITIETFEHDKFNELIEQETLEYFDNKFAKEKPSDNDLSIFLDFVTSINDEHVLVDNVATHEQHALGNYLASGKEYDLGRDIKDDDEHILKTIGIDNEPDTSHPRRKL
uniref:Uncharacterized protein n=1 Tax=Cucumis sativus TaxID=3659 RepID=A0A0A0KY93_CUCSA